MLCMIKNLSWQPYRPFLKMGIYLGHIGVKITFLARSISTQQTTSKQQLYVTAEMMSVTDGIHDICRSTVDCVPKLSWMWMMKIMSIVAILMICANKILPSLINSHEIVIDGWIWVRLADVLALIDWVDGNPSQQTHWLELGYSSLELLRRELFAPKT